MLDIIYLIDQQDCDSNHRLIYNVNLNKHFYNDHYQKIKSY